MRSPSQPVYTICIWVCCLWLWTWWTQALSMTILSYSPIPPVTSSSYRSRYTSLIYIVSLNVPQMHCELPTQQWESYRESVSVAPMQSQALFRWAEGPHTKVESKDLIPLPVHVLISITRKLCVWGCVRVQSAECIGVRCINNLIQVSKGCWKTGAKKSRHVANGPSADA